MKSFIAALLVLSWAGNLVASPVSDLSSPSSDIREAAAKTLRANYTPPSRTNWDTLVATLKIGDKMTNVEARLRALNIKPGLGSGEQLLSMEYRLDETWCLRCSYQYLGKYEGNPTLYGRDIFLSPIYVTVKGPTNFTGVWIEYYLNGQKCFETNLKDGLRCGDFTCYSSDGRKIYVEHHNPNNPIVETTEYYHSGSIKLQSKRDKTGRPIGDWFFYNEQDGSLMSTQSWPKL